MTIRLSKDLERFVHEAVRAGLYNSEDDVIRDALTRLRQDMPEKPKKPSDQPSVRTSKQTKAAAPKKKPLTRDEFNQRLMAAGLITRLPDPTLDIDDDDPDDQPVTIKGEPLSETIIRERR